MIVREQQLAFMRRAAEDAFVASLVAHVRAHFPDAAAALDGPALEAKVRAAIAEGRGHELTTRRDLARFLNVAVAFGWDLGAPGLEWIRAHLRDQEIPGPSARLDRLVADSIRRAELEERNARARAEFEG